MRGTRNRGSSLLTLLIPAGREGTCVYVCTHVCIRTRMCDQPRWNIGRMLFVRTSRACLRGFPIVYRPPDRGKIGGSRGGTDKQPRKVDKGPRIHDTWEPSINSTYGAPLLFQAKTRGDARLCHAHASYFIGKCANTVLNPSPLLVLLPLLSFLSFFFGTIFPIEISSFSSEW